MEERAYWLLPLAMLLVLVAIGLMVAQSSVLAPFIYTLF